MHHALARVTMGSQIVQFEALYKSLKDMQILYDIMFDIDKNYRIDSFILN